MISGAKRKNETWDAEDGDVMKVKSGKDIEKLATNPFFKLERQALDVERASSVLPRLQRLREVQSEKWEDDYRSSRVAREKFRQEKNDLSAEEKKNNDILKKNCLSMMPLLPLDNVLDTPPKNMSFKRLPKITTANLVKCIRSKRKRPPG